MGVTLITHVYNEAAGLLPHFVDHYRGRVDRAVVVDYDSDDGTAAALGRWAPEWERRLSVHRDFNAAALDDLVMEIEQEVDRRDPGGWKWAANATEFLLVPDLRAWCARHEAEGHDAVAVTSVVGVDDPAARPRPPPRRGAPLWAQVTHGYVDAAGSLRRPRVLHRHPTGRYHLGRHGSHHPTHADPDALLLWAGWSHLDALKRRKLQIQTRIPEADKRLGHGKEHLLDDAGLEAAYREQAARSAPLADDPRWRAATEAMR